MRLTIDYPTSWSQCHRVCRDNVTSNRADQHKTPTHATRALVSGSGHWMEDPLPVSADFPSLHSITDITTVSRVHQEWCQLHYNDKILIKFTE